MQKSVGFTVLLLFLCLLLCTVSVSYSAIIGENSKKEAYSLTSATTTVHSIKLAIMAPKPRMTKKRRLLEGDHSSADLCRATSYNESLSSEGNMQEIKNDQTFVASIAESSFHGDSMHDQIMARTAVMPKQRTSRRSLQLQADKSVDNSDCVQYVSEQSHKHKRRKPTSAINFNCGASTSNNLEVEIAASHGNSIGQASYQRRKCGEEGKEGEERERERAAEGGKEKREEDSMQNILRVVLAPLFCCLLFSAIFICYCDLDSQCAVEFVK